MKVHFTGGPLDGQTLDTAIDAPEQQYPLTMPDTNGQLIEGGYTVSFVAMAGKWTPKDEMLRKLSAQLGLPVEGRPDLSAPKEEGK